MHSGGRGQGGEAGSVQSPAARSRGDGALATAPPALSSICERLYPEWGIWHLNSPRWTGLQGGGVGRGPTDTKQSAGRGGLSTGEERTNDQTERCRATRQLPDQNDSTELLKTHRDIN